MKDFQRILEECLTKLSNGTATVDECLARYPEHAEQLLPLLQTVLLLNQGREITPSLTFNAYTRSAVMQYIRSHPRQPRNIVPLFQRTALTFAMLILALLITGTAQAQSALPGDTFYAWKRVSEQVWRVITPNPVATDLVLAERRLNEWIAVSNDPVLSPVAMNSYLDILANLEVAHDPEILTMIVPALQTQNQTLNDAGLSSPELDDYLGQVATLPVAASTQVPSTSTSIPPTEIPPTVAVIPPTATDVPPADTEVPPTATEVPPTATEIPPTATEIPPTATDVPTEVVPTDIPTLIPESTPTDEPLP